MLSFMMSSSNQQDIASLDSKVFYSCNMGTSDLPEMYAQSPKAQRAYISGKPQMPMLQLLCNTS